MSRKAALKISSFEVLSSQERHGRSIEKEAQEFFGRLDGSARGRAILSEQEHRIEFMLTDGSTFHVEIRGGKLRVLPGACEPRRFDVPDLIHFQLATETLRRLFRGDMRFTDALIPTALEGRYFMLLLECTLFKWGVLSWIGRLFRTAQLLPKRAET